jgi:hypothetical protein
VRSEPRGKQKPERRNCDGKLTGEAGPALRAVVHGEGVVGGEKSVWFGILRDGITGQYGCKWQEFPIAWMGIGKRFGIGGFLRGRAKPKGRWGRLLCGVSIFD